MAGAQEQIITRYYESTASRGSAHSRHFYEYSSAGLLRRLKAWLPADRKARCLDLACGTGELLYLLEQRGYEAVQGVDLCKEELDVAAQHTRARLTQDDVIGFLGRQPDHSFEFVTAMNILEHLSKDQVLTLLTEVARVLSPMGCFVAMVPNALSPFGASTRYWDVTHQLAFTPNNFRQLAPIANLSSDIDFKECGPVAYGLKSTIRRVMWEGIRAGISAWFLIELGTTRERIYTMDMLVRMRPRAKPGSSPA